MASEREQAKSRIQKTENDDPDRSELMAAARRKEISINRLNREDAKDGHIHIMAVIGIYGIGTSVIACLMVMLFNYAAPQQYRFLDDTALARLQALLLSGVIGSGLTTFIRKALK